MEGPNSKNTSTSLPLTDCSQALHCPRVPPVRYLIKSTVNWRTRNNLYSHALLIPSFPIITPILPLWTSWNHENINLNLCKYISMIQRLSFLFMMNCQRDFKMCPSILTCVLIRMIIMLCLNRLWWIPSPNILLQRLLDLKSINTGFPHGSLMVFCIPSNIEINCFGKYDPFQTERTSIYHYL